MTTNPMLLQSYKYDDLTFLTSKGSAFITGHYFIDGISPVNIFTSGPGGAMLGLFYTYLLYLIFRTPVRYIEKACDCKVNSVDVSDIEVDEDIPTYAFCLDEDDLSWTEKEEQLLRKYGMQTLLDQEMVPIQNAIQKIRKEKQQDPNWVMKKHLQGVHTYNILRNILYITAFQYVAANT